MASLHVEDLAKYKGQMKNQKDYSPKPCMNAR